MILLAIALSIAIHTCYVGSKVVISLAALDQGAEQIVIGAIAALYGAVPLLLSVASGRLADRIGMRAPMLAGAVIVAAALLTGHFGRGLAALFATATLMGAGFILFNVSVQNLAGALGKPNERARNFGWLSVGYSTSAFIGPTVAGFAMEYGGHPAAFLALAAFTALPITVLAASGRLTQVETAPAPESDSRKAGDLLRIPVLRRLIVSSGLLVAAWELYGFYLPIYGHGVGLSPARIGIVLAAYAAAAFLARFSLPLLLARAPAERVLPATTAIGALGFAALPFLTDLYALMALSAAIGLCLGCGQPLLMTFAFEHSPTGRTGEVTGLRLAANNAARVVVPLVAGAVGGALGTAPVFWINAANLLFISRYARG